MKPTAILSAFIIHSFLLMVVSSASASKKMLQPANDTIVELTGNFEDDYGIMYTISDSLWTQRPTTKYHITRWNKEEKFIIAKNDSANNSEGNLFTRIDYVLLNDMKPWSWAFCYSSYNLATAAEAENASGADKANPRKGCNGFPFSRMMRKHF